MSHFHVVHLFFLTLSAFPLFFSRNGFCSFPVWRADQQQFLPSCRTFFSSSSLMPLICLYNWPCMFCLITEEWFQIKMWFIIYKWEACRNLAFKSNSNLQMRIIVEPIQIQRFNPRKFIIIQLPKRKNMDLCIFDSLGECQLRMLCINWCGPSIWIPFFKFWSYIYLYSLYHGWK